MLANDGDVDFLQEVIKAFLEDIPVRAQTLRQAIAQGNIEEAERESHSIKGAAASVGAERIRAAALAVERAAKEEDMSKADALFGALGDELERFQRMIESFDWNSLRE